MKKLFVLFMAMFAMSSNVMADCNDMGLPTDQTIQKAFNALKNDKGFTSNGYKVTDIVRGTSSDGGIAFSFNATSTVNGKSYYTPYIGIMHHTNDDCTIMTSYGTSWDVK